MIDTILALLITAALVVSTTHAATRLRNKAQDAVESYKQHHYTMQE